jgi:transposase
LGRWVKLSIYATDGKLEIDNNLVENVIRPVALGRKNYLFAGSHEAAQRSAMLYSFMGTCKLRGVEPLQWLKTTLSKLPDHKANRLRELLPC